MSEIITVGLDLAKNVFQVHGADCAGRAVLRKKLRQGQVLEFFSLLPSCGLRGEWALISRDAGQPFHGIVGRLVPSLIAGQVNVCSSSRL